MTKIFSSFLSGDFDVSSAFKISPNFMIQLKDDFDIAKLPEDGEISFLVEVSTNTIFIIRKVSTNSLTLEDLEVRDIEHADQIPKLTTTPQLTIEKSYYTAFIFVMFLCVLIVSVFGIIGYAYFHPNSVTGRILIKVICVLAFI